MFCHSTSSELQLADNNTANDFLTDGELRRSRGFKTAPNSDEDSDWSRLWDENFIWFWPFNTLSSARLAQASSAADFNWCLLWSLSAFSLFYMWDAAQCDYDGCAGV